MPKNIVSENIDIPKTYNAMERRLIANDIIQYVRKRTKSGRGEGNQKWKGAAGKYSPSYQKSLDYKLKPSKGVVDLTLSGDMLTAIELRQSKKGQIQIGIPFSAQEWDRAKGNILGSYGRAPNRNKARPFLKLSKGEVKKILSKYPTEENKREQNLEKLIALDEILRSD